MTARADLRRAAAACLAGAGLLACAASLAQVPVPFQPPEPPEPAARGRAAAAPGPDTASGPRTAASPPADVPASAALAAPAASAWPASGAVDPPAVPVDSPRLVRAEPPRDSAWHIADVVTYRALIDWPAGWEIDRDGLPPRERNDAPLELRGHRIREAPAEAGACRRCRWLELEWQVFRAPRLGEDLRLPAAAVRWRRDRDIATLTLQAAQLAVFPLVPWESRRDWLDSQRPGWQAESLDVTGRLVEAGVASGVAALSLLGWARVSGRLPSGRRRPFADAWRALRSRRDDWLDAEDFRRWHAAFDATAGEVVLADDLPRFFERHPAHAPQAEAVGRLFDVSRRHFFLDDDVRGDGRPAPVPVRTMLSVLRALADAEWAAPRRPPAPPATKGTPP